MPNDPRFHPVYKSINKPLAIWGVERRLFFLALIMGGGHTCENPLQSVAIIIASPPTWRGFAPTANAFRAAVTDTMF